MTDKDETMNEIIKQKEKRKKMLLISVCVVVGIFVVFGLTYLILSPIKSGFDARKAAKWEAKYGKIPSYVFAEPDYNFDIFSDPGYMEKDRGVKYFDGAGTTTITDANLSVYAPEVQFMYNVVQMLIRGQYEEYKKIFTDEYLKNAGDDFREQFTMQQLYDIQLETVDYSIDGDVINPVISVSYKIRNNTGTLRTDLDCNEEAWRPVVYMLTMKGSDIKVTNYMPLSKYEYVYKNNN